MKQVATSLFERLELTNLNDEQKEALLKQLSDVLAQRISMRIFDTMTPDQQKQFEVLQQKNDAPATDAFLVKTIPNLNDLAREETEKLIKETKTELAQARQKFL